MICETPKRMLVIHDGEDVVVNEGIFGKIFVMEGGNLELGEDVQFDEVILNAESAKPISIRGGE